MMRKIFSMLLLCATVVFASCSKDDPAPESVAVAFSTLTANGSATETTTLLTLTFDKVIEGLTAESITLTAGETGAVKGALTAKSNGVYELVVSGIAKAGDVTIAVAKAGYTITPASKTIAVKYFAIGNFYYSDKTYSATYNSNKTCIGIVFWIDPNDATKGKIVSLDEGIKTWSEAKTWTSSTVLPNGMTWSCPTKDELQHLYCGYAGIAAQTWETDNCPTLAVAGAKNAFNAQLTAASGTVLSDIYYWSSTEFSSIDIFSVNFDLGKTYFTNIMGGIFCNVRAISAF